MGYGGIIGQQFDGYTQNQTLTQAVAALYGLGTDAVPNDVFNILSKSALCKTVTTTQQIGNLAEGQIIYLNENNSPVEFYVAKHDYESSLNGTGRTLVVRKDTYDDRAWDSGNVNTYASSDLDSWFNNTYKNMLDADIRSLIGTTKIRYTPGNGNWTVGTLSRSVFALSFTELGKSNDYANVEGSALPIASTLQIIYQWTRSPHTGNTYSAWRLFTGGSSSGSRCDVLAGARPAFTLPSTLAVSAKSTLGLYDTQGNLIMSIPSMGFSPASVVTGSYVGTGTYGSGNPNTLTFDFEPKIVFISDEFKSNSGTYWFDGCLTSYTNLNSNTQYKVNWSKSLNTISFYSTSSAYYQMNQNGVNYFYIAIGQ